MCVVWLLVLVVTCSTVRTENVINVMLVSTTEMRDILESVTAVQGNKDLAISLRNHLQGQLYMMNVQVDLKSLKLGVSLRESSLSVVLPECSQCLASRRNDTYIEKFSMIYRLKCMALRDSRDCVEYSISGRTGSSANTNINFGYLGFDLKDTRFIKSVSNTDVLTRLESHGLIGVGPADLEGNFESSFLRIAQEEADISFSSVELSFLSKNMSLAIGSGERLRTGDDYIWNLQDNSEISMLVSKVAVGGGTLIDLENSFILDTTVACTQVDRRVWELLLTGLQQSSQVKEGIKAICNLTGTGELRLNDTHICDSFAWNQQVNVDLDRFAALKTANPEIHLVVPDQGRVRQLRMKHLFVISTENSKLDQDLQSDHKKSSRTFRLRLGFEQGDRNILGMNLLDYKTLRIDYYSLQVQISQCPDGQIECEYEKVVSDVASDRQVKVIIEIATFISLIALVFAGIISFDKYVNEDEYMKE